MSCSLALKALAGAALAAPVLAAAAMADPAALEAIARNCERCHPPLPGGGWEVMTARPHDRAGIASILRRMAEEYSVFPSEAERKAMMDYLGEGG